MAQHYMTIEELESMLAQRESEQEYEHEAS
jgi:hypothetical protein